MFQCVISFRRCTLLMRTATDIFDIARAFVSAVLSDLMTVGGGSVFFFSPLSICSNGTQCLHETSGAEALRVCLL